MEPVISRISWSELQALSIQTYTVRHFFSVLKKIEGSFNLQNVSGYYTKLLLQRTLIFTHSLNQCVRRIIPELGLHSRAKERQFLVFDITYTL